MFTMGPQLDNGVGALLVDLKSSGMLDETLVVMVGEFGRTPGGLTPAAGPVGTTLPILRRQTNIRINWRNRHLSAAF